MDEPWQYRVLDSMPAGIDVAQLKRSRPFTRGCEARRRGFRFLAGRPKDLLDLEALRALEKARA